jgi:hypothetical protein
MADQPNQKSLGDVVEQLQELNDATAMAQESAYYTQELNDYMRTEGRNLDSSQLYAIEDLIEVLKSGKLDELEAEKEQLLRGRIEAKRDNERNDLLETIAKYTTFSYEQLKDEFGDKGRGTIAGIIINTAIRGLLIGFFASAFLEPFKLIGKGLSAIGTKIGKLLGMQGFFKGLRVSIQTTVTNGFKAMTGIFKSKGNKPPGFLMKSVKQLQLVFMDSFRIMTTILGNVTKVAAATTGFLAGRFRALESLTKLKFSFPVDSKLMKGIARALNTLFKPLTGLINLFTGQAGVVIKSVDSAGRALGTSSKVVNSLGTSVVNFFKALKPIKTVFGFLASIGGAFKGVGQVLGRFFGIFNFIFGFFKGFKQYEDGSFLTKVFAGIMGGFKQMLLMGPVFLLDGLRFITGKILGLFGFDKAAEVLASFSFRDIVGKAFDAVTDTIINFFARMRDTISDIGFGGIIKNITISLLKIFKKIATFPQAVAAGGLGAIAASLPGGKTPMEGFKEGFDKVFTAGDTALDGLKAKADGMDKKGMLIDAKSREGKALKDQVFSGPRMTDQEAARRDTALYNIQQKAGDTVTVISNAANQAVDAVGGMLANTYT